MSMSCYVCGQLGTKSQYYGKHDSAKKLSDFLMTHHKRAQICDVVIYLGTYGAEQQIPCCTSCFRIGKRWSGIEMGFHKSTDYDYIVRKDMEHHATIRYRRYLPDGDLGDMGRPTKVALLQKTKHSGILSYDYTFTLTSRQMRDGKWIQVQKPKGVIASDWEFQRQEIKPEYTRSRWVLEEFKGASHMPFKAGQVELNTNTRVNWQGETERTFERVRLIKATGEKDANGLQIWIAEDYELAKERSAKILQKWWRSEYSKYYGPKHNGRKLEARKREYPRLRAYQRSFECVLCGGYTTNQRIQQEGAECKVCTGWTIDERYCQVCDCELAGERTTGCPGC